MVMKIMRPLKMKAYFCSRKMRYSFIILTFMGLLLQTFSKGLVLAEFMLNKEYIATVLCINRDKPKLHCDGQCVLMKRMAKETKQEQQGNAVKDKYEVVISEVVPQFSITPALSAEVLYSVYAPALPADPLHAVFHPPRA